MVDGRLLVMGGGLLPGSDELNLSRLLPGQVVACSWTWSSTLIRSWVAMAAIKGRASTFLQHPNARAGVAPVWCKVATEGDSPTIPVNFDLFYNKFCLVLWIVGVTAAPLAAGFHAGGDADASSDQDVLQDIFLQILVGCNFICSSRPCNLYLLTKDWTSICTTPWYFADSLSISSHFSISPEAIGSPQFLLLQVWYIIIWNEKLGTIMDLNLLKNWLKKMNCRIITQTSPMIVNCGVLPIAQTQGKYKESDKFNLAGLHIDLCTEANLEMGNASEHKHDCIFSSRCTRFFMADDRTVEDTAPLFGLCHQRWTTTPLSLIPRFNSKGPSRLSSVTVLQNLQLSSPTHRMHTPDRPSGEPTAGHQLV